MLITCPECGGKLSDKAQACPTCGFPMEEIRKRSMLIIYDPETMTGRTPEDNRSIEIATDLYGELLVSGDGRVWNDGGQVVGWMKYK